MNHFFRKQAGRNLVLLPETPQKLLLSQPTLADIKHRFPKRPLDIMVPTQLAGLAARFAQVDEVYNLPDPNMSWKTFWKAGLAMQGKDHAHAWVLPDRFKPALIPMLANIGERTGYRGRYRYSLLIDIRLPNKARHPHLVDRYRALAWDIVDELPETPALSLTSDTQLQHQARERFRLVQDKPVLAFCPGTLGVPEPARQQQPEPEQWQTLLNQWVEEGGQIWLLASHNEQLEVDVLLESLPQATRDALHNLSGHINWEEAVDLLSQAQVAVGLDNALSLVALGCGLPVYLPVRDSKQPDTRQWLAPAVGAQVVPISELRVSPWY
ncbi:lipopolysaccharide heptosyltransferase II [Marinospirillum sp.]|uniref:lipopolysaccharide heptosyltransferase II n=1 Tax=Marinospirillum sp. TaxID=2183934 RepID=UPI00384E442C